jgi:hypothetical protein
MQIFTLCCKPSSDLDSERQQSEISRSSRMLRQRWSGVKTTTLGLGRPGLRQSSGGAR